MKIKTSIVLSLIVSSITFTYSQNDIQIGSQQGAVNNQRGAYFDYSDPSGVNIKVQLWGYVEFPGYYVVPAGFSVNELISLGGGPTQDALLNDIRVVKLKEGSQPEMIKYNYNDLMWDENIKSQIKFVKLDAGDIVVIPGEPRYFLRQDVAFYLTILTTLASIGALIISITHN